MADDVNFPLVGQPDLHSGSGHFLRCDEEQEGARALSENPHGYWCRPCGRSREHAEHWRSSAECKERQRREDDLKSRGFNSEAELHAHLVWVLGAPL